MMMQSHPDWGVRPGGAWWPDLYPWTQPGTDQKGYMGPDLSGEAVRFWGSVDWVTDEGMGLSRPVVSDHF